ncbi:MAG: VWA domain-containing protein [Candidatus Hydrogenedentes bacterium]|nr:VWA domain-containing protein [Candidatus Hydrogenedentota bacterium]
MQRQSTHFGQLAIAAMTGLLALPLVSGCARAHYHKATFSPVPTPYPMADTAFEAAYAPEFNTEAYDHLQEIGFKHVTREPLSTFSIDVDTASYSNVRRFLNNGSPPPAGAVRIEEMLNYFRYDYAPPADDAPFATHMEVAACPWKPDHLLARIGLKGKEFPREQRPPANLVFLVDVSGSMNMPDKLPLVQRSLRMLVEEMNEQDRIAIAVYAGASGLALPSTTCDNKMQIVAALDELQAGGSTNGGEGIQLAYRVAGKNFIQDGINRVILATDGDFNVGITNQSALVDLIEEKREEGIFLTVLGFGTGNLKDSTMEKLANKGNGSYAYIDSLNEARKVLVEQVSGTLHTIAKDVKIQVEFNPERIAAYRLLGYENRMLQPEDFNNDKVDAGEIGAGHTVTAMYELVPAGVESPAAGVDPLRYQAAADTTPAAGSDELFLLKLRYKAPDDDTSSLLEFPFARPVSAYAEASNDFRFASAVASFGMLLRNSEYKGDTSYRQVQAWAEEGLGDDEGGYRKEMIQLVKKSADMQQKVARAE